MGKQARTARAQARPELRFKVGDLVQCRVGPGTGDDAWASGTVASLWYTERGFPPDRAAPYQVKLHNGPLIFAPMDDDRVIRALTALLKDGKIPVTILTGFLGAGKTTLLNYILNVPHGKRYAVIENEVGAVGIDNQLLKTEGYKKETVESIKLLDNGCLCCTVREDLVTAIKDIVDAAKARMKEDGEDSRPLDGILIETTGIADPGPICKTFYGDAFVSSYCSIDGILTVVDALHFAAQLTRERSPDAVNESAQQIAFADKILLNKVDLASPEKLEDAMKAIRGINSFAPITRCSLGKSPEAVPLSDLLSIDAFDLTKLLKEDMGFDLSVCGVVTEGSGDASMEEKIADDDHENCSHGEGHGDGHAGEHGDSHKHGHESDGHRDAHEHGHECSEHCEHHGHDHDHGHVASRHDTEIGSFVCELVGKPVSSLKFQGWMHSLLEHSENLYRFKGILAMQDPHGGEVFRLVLQGVHDVVTTDEGGSIPPEEVIKSQVVVIGRKLDRAAFQESFAQIGV